MAENKPSSPNKFNWGKLIFTLVILGGIVALALWMFGVFNKHVDVLSLDGFKNAKVKEWTWDFQHGKILMVLENGDDKAFNIPVQDDTLNTQLWKIINGDIPKGTGIFAALTTVNFHDFKALVTSSKGTGSFLLQTILPILLYVVLFGGMLWWLHKKQSGQGGVGGTSFKNQARKVTSNKKFSDVAGQEEVKEEVKEVVDFLKHPNKYKAAGARIPKGIMLGGPPGTGKTLLAKAVAGEAGVPFYYVSASNFVEMYVGLGAKRVREMFKEARKIAPSIIFIDELDAVGKKRNNMSSNDEREGTLNQILVEMDGMDENSGLLIIGATNRPEILDPALLRPGRFDRTITVSLPDIKERQAILELHARGKRIAKDVNFANIAKRIPRFSGAQIENIMNEAALLSVREKSGVITLPQIDEAIDRVMAGPAKKNRVITERENKVVAVHEAGHAVIGLKVKDADIVQKITIIPRGNAGGYTLFTPKEETYNYTKSQLLSKIMGLLGGRAAEQAIYGKGEVSTGASNDIERATALARAMVTQYGMSALGPIAYERDAGAQYLGAMDKYKDYSTALGDRIDEAIREIILEAEVKAIKIVKKHLKLHDLIVQELLEKETIVLEEIDYINKNLKRVPKNLIKKSKTESKKSLKEILAKVEKQKEKEAEQP